MAMWKPVYTLTARELQRFTRQRSRILGALGTPIVFWLLIGSGLGRSFTSDLVGPGGSFLEYFFPGTFTLVILFTAIFSSISLIEDRHEGFLQGVLVAPAPRRAIVLGKILGSTILAAGQALLFLALAPLAGVPLTWSQIPALVLATVLVAFALGGLGFAAAWKIDSVQGFHAIMNLVLIPMWILSGALFPEAGASRWMALLLKLNPLTYGVAAVRHALYSPGSLEGGGLPGWPLSLAVTALFGALCFGVSVLLLRSRVA
jgi:ABC-2 type transport system permease protein